MTHRPPTTPQLYPKRYWDASPTWKQWNSITAADLHALRFERGFEGQSIYFHLNHPIQYVRVVGVLVELELIANKYVLLSLDDGSGARLTVKLDVRSNAKDDDVVCPSNTTVDNVDVHVNLGFVTLQIGGKAIDVGTIIKAKGVISTFRDVRQLELKLVAVVHDTNAEAACWVDTARWKRDVLSRPWELTEAQRGEVDAGIRREQQREQDDARRERKQAARHARYADKKRRQEEKDEVKRRAREQEYNEGALAESNVFTAPWE